MGQAASCWCLTMMSWGRMRGWGTSKSRWAGSRGAVQYRGMVLGSDLWLAAARQHSKYDSPMQTSDVGAVLDSSAVSLQLCDLTCGCIVLITVRAQFTQSHLTWTRLLVILVVLLLGRTWPTKKYQISPCFSSLKYVGLRESGWLSYCSCSCHSNR